MTSLSAMTGIIGSCTDCGASANLFATVAVALVGFVLATDFEGRKRHSSRFRSATVITSRLKARF